METPELMDDQQIHQNKIWSYYQNEGIDSFTDAEPRLDYLLAQILKLSNPTEMPAVLNIGVGSGYFEKRAKQHGLKIFAVDPDERAIKVLQTIEIEAQVGYVEKLPFDENYFHFVVASEVLEHLSDEQRALGLQEIQRVLKPTGYFIGTVPFNENLVANVVLCPHCGELFHRWGHQKSFHLNDIKTELELYLNVITVKSIAFVYFKQRSLFGKLKSLTRLVLGRLGNQLAFPNIYFVAQK